jgi:hypothetical protein
MLLSEYVKDTAINSNGKHMYERGVNKLATGRLDKNAIWAHLARQADPVMASGYETLYLTLFHPRLHCLHLLAI